MEKENGKLKTIDISKMLSVIDGEELRVVFDGEGKRLKAVMKELDARRRRERDEKRREEERKRQDEERRKRELNTPRASASHTPSQGGPWRDQSLKAEPLRSSHGPTPSHPPRSGLHPHSRSPIPHPSSHAPNARPGTPNELPLHPPARVRRPPPQLERARNAAAWDAAPYGSRGHNSPHPPLPPSRSTSPPRGRGRYGRYRDRIQDYSPDPGSRSPSPINRRPRFGRGARPRDHAAVLEDLARNGFHYAAVQGHGGGLSSAVREEDVRFFFRGFDPDKVRLHTIGPVIQANIVVHAQVMRVDEGWYVTFSTPDAAQRAGMVLNSGARTLVQHSVNVFVRPAPSLSSISSLPSKTRWTDAELIEQAEKLVLKDLRAMLEKDILERVVGTELRRIVAEEKERRKEAGAERKESGEQLTNGSSLHPSDSTASLQFSSGLKGLSFRKQKRHTDEIKSVPAPETTPTLTPTVPEHEPEPEPELEHELEHEPEQEAESPPTPEPWVEEQEAEPMEIDIDPRPKKKPKKAPRRTQIEDIESEDDLPAPIVSITVTPEFSQRKRASSVSSQAEEPPKKKTKTKKLEETAKSKKSKKVTKKATQIEEPTTVEELIHEVITPIDRFEPPAVAQVRVTPGFDATPSPPASPIVRKKLPQKAVPPQPTPVVDVVDPFEAGICEDDEDAYFAKLALDEMLFGNPPLAPAKVAEASPDVPPPFRVHVTGSARTEGYYKISHAEKSAYVAQYAQRGTANDKIAEEEPPQPQNVTSSRSNRANARRRAQGLEEINQVQLAMALSKGENAATELVKFNQLQTRKKHMRFARSPIHDWGLYAMEKISRGEMVIEYVGEVIRAQVADKREKAYERQGIGSSYLFRIDEDLVVDATKKGNLGYVLFLC